MKEELVFQLGDENRCLRIILHHRPYPTSSHAWDRDVIACTLEVLTADIQGIEQTFIWTHELEELSNLLIKLSHSVGHEEHVQFELREHTLKLLFKLTPLGHIEVQVQVGDIHEEYPTILTFFILADQTYLPRWISDVRKTLQYFPREL